MGSLRRMLGALFGPRALKSEDVVFEPIEAPVTLPQSRVLEMQGETRTGAHRVALGDLMERVPLAWRRSGDWAPEQMVELPAEARLNAGAERPLAFSLRYLVKKYPDLFRDPGALLGDPGVDLAMEHWRDTEPALSEIPSEVVSEVEGEVSTFKEWEGEIQSRRVRTKEDRETLKVLREVNLPPVKISEDIQFKDILDGGGELAESNVAPAQKPVAFPSTVPANARLKRILEAYAEGLSPSAPVVTGDPSRRGLQVVEGGRGDKRVEHSNGGIAEREAVGTDVPSRVVVLPPNPTVVSPAPRGVDESRGGERMRFEELGLSLSRFSEVRGFVLWLGEQTMQTGDVCFDTHNALTRSRMENLLESAVLTQGSQDGFLSVTVHHARGGVSIFGSGSCLVAVSHQSEGMPAHLRAWLCGWVSQPLRS